MTKRPAILQVIPHLDAGGAELSTLEIVEALGSIGVRALVATQGGRMASQVERLGGEIINMPVATKNPLQMYRNKQFLEQMIVKNNVLLLHVRSRAPAWSSMLASAKIQIPFVTTYHGAYGEMEPFKRLYNSVMARGDIVIANSRFTADLIRTRYQMEAKRLRVIYRGVDIEKFSKSAVSNERKKRLLSKWGVAEGRKIILHPARLTRLKGHGVVISAMKKLIQSGQDSDAVVIFAGDYKGRSSYVEELRQGIAANGLEDRVHFIGHCSDMAAAYAVSHVTLIASIEPETFGRTSAEAQAMGCPVIATNIGAPSETIRSTPEVPSDQRTGWLVPPNDPDMLTKLLRKVLSMDRADYVGLAARATANIAQNFSDKLMKAQTLKAYDELLGTGFAEDYNRVQGLKERTNK